MGREGHIEWRQKIPPGPIKCLINSRTRIGRNNEHLSEPFIAYKALSPAFSHLIFTTGPGGRYYHYLHFIGEGSKLPHLPAWAGQAAYLGRRGRQRRQGLASHLLEAVVISPQTVIGSKGKSRLRPP